MTLGEQEPKKQPDFVRLLIREAQAHAKKTAQEHLLACQSVLFVRQAS